MNSLPSSVSDKQASEFLSACVDWTSVSIPLCFNLDFFAKKLMWASDSSLMSNHFRLWVFIIWIPYMGSKNNSDFPGILSDVEIIVMGLPKCLWQQSFSKKECGG